MSGRPVVGSAKNLFELFGAPPAGEFELVELSVAALKAGKDVNARSLEVFSEMYALSSPKTGDGPQKGMQEYVWRSDPLYNLTPL